MVWSDKTTSNLIRYLPYKISPRTPRLNRCYQYRLTQIALLLHGPWRVRIAKTLAVLLLSLTSLLLMIANNDRSAFTVAVLFILQVGRQLETGCALFNISQSDNIQLSLQHDNDHKPLFYVRLQHFLNQNKFNVFTHQQISLSIVCFFLIAFAMILSALLYCFA